MAELGIEPKAFPTDGNNVILEPDGRFMKNTAERDKILLME